jgi:hypothetical protein
MHPPTRAKRQDTPPGPPRYTLRTRENALYLNDRLHGVDAILTAASRRHVTVEYTVATRPREGRVSHQIPAPLITIDTRSVTRTRAARTPILTSEADPGTGQEDDIA